jgi:hypothetical protein
MGVLALSAWTLGGSALKSPLKKRLQLGFRAPALLSKSAQFSHRHMKTIAYSIALVGPEVWLLPTRRVLMAKTCSNPRCLVRPDTVGAGALYALQKTTTDRSSHRNELLWLCASCSARSVLVTDAEGSVVVVSRANTLTSSRLDGKQSIRLVFASPSVSLRTHTTIWK